MNLGIIVQARLGSQRLPGKTLRPMGGRPMLQYTLERLDRCVSPHTLVVATSDDPQDDPIARFCAEHRYECFRGDHLNVALRFQRVFETYAFDAAVRISGDSPFMDPKLVDMGVAVYCQEGNPDLVTNVFPRSFPPGESVELLNSGTFARAFAQMSAPEDLEHVTKFYYSRPTEFRIVNFRSDADYSGVKLAIDTPEDFRLAEGIVAQMTRPHWQYGLPEVAELYRHLVAKGAGGTGGAGSGAGGAA